MENSIQLFEHEEFGQIRAIEIDGEIYFVGLDVAKALGYKNPRDAVHKKVDEEDKKVINSYALNIRNKKGNPNLTVINESGYYSLVLARQINKKDNNDISQKIKKFKRWVTSEVLPTIRKTGSYNPNPQKLEEHTTIHTEKLTIKVTCKTLYI